MSPPSRRLLKCSSAMALMGNICKHVWNSDLLSPTYTGKMILACLCPWLQMQENINTALKFLSSLNWMLSNDFTMTSFLKWLDAYQSEEWRSVTSTPPPKNPAWKCNVTRKGRCFSLAEEEAKRTRRWQDRAPRSSKLMKEKVCVTVIRQQ